MTRIDALYEAARKANGALDPASRALVVPTDVVIALIEVYRVAVEHDCADGWNGRDLRAAIEKVEALDTPDRTTNDYPCGVAGCFAATPVGEAYCGEHRDRRPIADDDGFLPEVHD